MSEIVRLQVKLPRPHADALKRIADRDHRGNMAATIRAWIEADPGTDVDDAGGRWHISRPLREVSQTRLWFGPRKGRW